MPAAETHSTVLLVGASRGLGLGLAQEYLARGWRVVATTRGDSDGLAALAKSAGGRLRQERVDITDSAAVAALRQRLAGERLDLLFLVAGISGSVEAPIHEVAAEAAARVYLTNAFYPVLCAEALLDLVAPGGTVAFMTSQLGSIAANTAGRWETYRASKAALNMLARGFFVRHAASGVTVLSIAPGWVRTDMGGASAPLDVATSVRGVADTIAARTGAKASLFVNYENKELPW